MFYPEDIVSSGKASTKQDVYLNNRRAFHVRLHMVQFTQQGMIKIGQFIHDCAERTGFPIFRIKELMHDKMYTVPPNPSLYFLFHIPEMDADVHVEIPKTFWRYTELADVTTEAPKHSCGCKRHKANAA